MQFTQTNFDLSLRSKKLVMRMFVVRLSLNFYQIQNPFMFCTFKVSNQALVLDFGFKLGSWPNQR